ncbi:hypothetical protein Psal006b_01110 [Piscirickettsia salmonis]|uniref:Transposase n=1 Tax=Piscirickettsia salmonis TaxID=1238 RepID=A0AAC8VIQ0_PISSA|nr:transposase [Piscirickettsia salmonis]QGN98126.1 hypothetical protein Psal006b_01110 [Piscirickettsia salmonis]QGO01741.1 hypothetical protein Psal008_01122 [Piscirickettsia salmonis]QGO12438.1 hypothetical protein Psal010b_01111 [Piscirickettsia salmonis]QGO19472.1 hypothetical protein Psal013_01116 [Piscirickettsia salmonis]
MGHLIQAVPYKIHTVLTDNGVQFTNHKHNKRALKHIFDRVCESYDIEHRLTKVNHPWTNGQVERMNRTLKEATVKRYHYESHDQVKEREFDITKPFSRLYFMPREGFFSCKQ